jgi:hypothetical protein
MPFAKYYWPEQAKEDEMGKKSSSQESCKGHKLWEICRPTDFQ